MLEHSVYEVEGKNFPVIAKVPDAKAEGVLVEGLSQTDLARLDYYEGPYTYKLVETIVQTGEGPQAAYVYFPDGDIWQPGAPWTLALWQERYGALKREAAHEIMSLFGRVDVGAVAARMPMIEARAQARVNGRLWQKPVALRSGMTAGDVEMQHHHQAYSHFFALEELKLRHRKFNGDMGPVVDRAIFVSADAVTVLPYDPKRDRVLVIEQFRPGAYLRGDPVPWQLEAIAGRLDAFEAPQETAHREALEEAGLALSELHEIGRYYPSPGIMTEYLVSYLAIADLPDGLAGVGGLDTEDEDIRSMLVSFERIMEALDHGEVDNGPLALTLHWLARHRTRLRSAG